MRKFVLCLIFTFLFHSSAYAITYYGIPKYCRTQIEFSGKESVMKQIIEDMDEEGYELIQKSSISLLFETPLRKANRFNYAKDFGLHWFSLNRYGWKRSEFSSPVYQLEVTVIKKTVSSVEVEITPLIIWNPGNAYQENIYEYYSKTIKALNEYLSSLKENFENK